MLKISIILCKRLRSLGLAPLERFKRLFQISSGAMSVTFAEYRYATVDPLQVAAIKLDSTIMSPMIPVLCNKATFIHN